MYRRLIAALTLFSLSASPAVTAEPSEALLREAAELRDLALAESDAWRHAASLSTEVGPRLAGSSGDRAAVAWALAYLDGFGFDTVIPQTVTVPAWERGEAELRITAPWPQPLVGVSLGLTIGTPADGIEAPVVRFESLAALEAATSAMVRGHIVFIDEKMERTRDGSGYSAAVAKRSRGPSVASERGAVATVIRSVGTSSERFAYTGTTRFAEGVRPIPAFALAAPDADMLARQVATGRDVLLHLYSTARQLPPARSANIIADIQGATHPEEIVILGAHLDSWDLSTGAQDNATGVAIVLEVARLIAARERAPARTVRVVLYANEEAGLDGSRAYTAAALEAGLRHVIGLEADAGAGRVYALNSGVGEEALPVVEAMRGVLAPLGIAGGDNATRGGADLSTLRDAGMPLLRLEHDMSTYFDVHHTVNDTLDKVDPETLRHAVAAYAAVTWIAANVEEDFGAYPETVPPVDPAASGN
ncbi:M20/M25/M40 family metallo-hydrolase [Wenzhouxiangella sp. XN24]|uniref:M20/M25/M40 family metallo-hydrolase n=1 Tax=Wenzhouxiangella sp. XN24 TaxID=2713569 RepID=UPI0013ED0497|nr:M20/M25/M40 family metallo-hydrolase [Wenzhouxiangella sp. XN24]NGX16828.1 M20/M25/M40 family metallo-hydrolase [Wenzhouxiangella sp. XN24]